MPPSPERLPDLAIREGNWKLLCEYDGGKPQLYDLAIDRAETLNLATKHPEKVMKLSMELLDWNKSLPADNGPALGKPQIKQGK
jgi:uncharacterized sulfatase